MDGNYKPYSYTASSDRIKDILDKPVGSFQEVDGLPDRDTLTFTNGFYGMCSAIFVDVRDSSGLTNKHKRPTLAKIYRAFISEMVAVLNSDLFVREVNIVGDCVWAVYKTTKKTHIDDVFNVAAKANTLVKLLNHHLANKKIDPIAVGIGIDYGRVLMIKAGFSGSGINDVIYMGDVVNRAAHLAHEAGRGWGVPPMLAGSLFHQNLNEHNGALFQSRWTNSLGTVHSSGAINIAMNDWIDSLA